MLKHNFTLTEARKLRVKLARDSGIPFDYFDWSDDAMKAFQDFINMEGTEGLLGVMGK